ncbi:hypothetical protein BJV82DRAFT_6814 [Fennellomyces sp. T-0311]|nr:hypothetical protein BJV82DRAFT_6814 [Fennellomyces sp. T-0311]
MEVLHGRRKYLGIRDYAVDLIQAYWADRGGTDAQNAARKGKLPKKRKASAKKDKELQSTKRTSVGSFSTRDETTKRARIEDEAEAIAKSPSPPPQQPTIAPVESPYPPTNEEYIESSTEVETAAAVRETPPPATDEQSHPPEETTPHETIVEAKTTNLAHIATEGLPTSDGLQVENETPEEPPLLEESTTREKLAMFEGSPLHEDPSIFEEPHTLDEPPVSDPPVSEPPVSDPPVSEPPVSEPPAPEPPASEEPPALDMSPVLEESPTIGEPPIAKIPPVHEVRSTPPVGKEPPPTMEHNTMEDVLPEEPNAERERPTIELEAVDEEMIERLGGENHIANQDVSVSAARVEPEFTTTTKDYVQADTPMVGAPSIANKRPNNDIFVTISDTDEPTVALDEDQILDILGNDNMELQQATVLGEQEVQRAMHGSVTSRFKPSERNLKPISEINSEEVIYDDNFPADPADWANVKEVVAVTKVPHDTPDSETFIVVRWNNGILSMHTSEKIRTHCAPQLINFYEKSLKFVV